jgi:hypothetical protein
MMYPRPAYQDPSVPTEKAQILFTTFEVDIPKLETPVTPLENFRRVAERKNPIWAPNSMSDFHNLMLQDIAVGPQIGADFSRRATEDYGFTDWYGVPMTWVVSAGGATNTPGTHLLEDINDWEKVVKFPNLKDWDWTTKRDAFMKNVYKPGRVLQIDLGWGCIQRLIGVLGGYTEGMYALALDGGAVRAFFDRFAEHMIELADLMFRLYPVNLITLHDDWGTEKDTFFSPKTMEELLFEPTKRIVDFVKSKGAYYMQHTCGNVTRFIPYMIDMGTDFLQIQRRAVDIPAMKAKYGDRIGFNTGIEGVEPGVTYTKEQMAEKIRGTVDTYAKCGGFFANVYGGGPEELWNTITELYACSREYYDREQGR